MVKSDYTLSFDWIEFTTKGSLRSFSEITKINGRSYLMPKPFGNKIFNDMASFFYMGQEIATIQFNPRSSKVLDPQTVIIKMANDVCYEDRVSDLIRLMMAALSLKFNNWTRLDIALDGKELLRPLELAAMNKDVRIVSRSDITWRRSGCRKGYTKSLMVGSKVSDSALCAYNKTKELEKSQKHYIPDFWKRNGMDTTGDVERVEIRMKSQELKRYDEFNPRKQSDPVGILDKLKSNKRLFERLFMTASKRLYEFVPIDAKHTDKAKRVYKLDLKRAGTKLLNKASRLAKSELGRMKQAAKTLHWVSIATGNKLYDMASKDIADMVDHGLWRDDKRNHWTSEFKLRAGKERFQFLSSLEIDTRIGQLILWPGKPPDT